MRRQLTGRSQLWQDGMVTRRLRSKTHRMLGSTARKASPLPGDLTANCSAGSEPAGVLDASEVALAQAPTEALLLC